MSKKKYIYTKLFIKNSGFSSCVKLEWKRSKFSMSSKSSSSVCIYFFSPLETGGIKNFYDTDTKEQVKKVYVRGLGAGRANEGTLPRIR